MRSYRHINYMFTVLIWDLLLISSLLFTYPGHAEVFGYAHLVLITTWMIANVNLPPTSNRRFVSYVHAYVDVVRPYSLFLLFYLAFLRVFHGEIEFSYSLIKFMALLLLVILFGRTLFVFALRVYRKLGYGPSLYMLVGEKKASQFIRGLFDRRPENGYRFIDSFDWGEEKLQTWFKRLEKNNRLVDEIYLYPNAFYKKELNELLNRMRRLKINVYLIPFDSTRHIEFYNFRSINGCSAEEVLKGPLVIFRKRILKRLFDIIFSLAVLLFVLSWLLPILCLIVKIGSRGPAFFVQTRSGRNGIKFPCYKLRTMYCDPFRVEKQAIENDPRITPFGRILRTFSLDELPQFLNVLFGHMSVVGPRPHPLFLDDKFSNEIPNYTQRLIVKPGVTGLSQSFSYRGEIKTKADMMIRVNTDLVYIRNWTLLLDLKIVTRTIKSSLFFSSENAY